MVDRHTYLRCSLISQREVAQVILAQGAARVRGRPRGSGWRAMGRGAIRPLPCPAISAGVHRQGGRQTTTAGHRAVVESPVKTREAFLAVPVVATPTTHSDEKHANALKRTGAATQWRGGQSAGRRAGGCGRTVPKHSGDCGVPPRRSPEGLPAPRADRLPTQHQRLGAAGGPGARPGSVRCMRVRVQQPAAQSREDPRHWPVSTSVSRRVASRRNVTRRLVVVPAPFYLLQWSKAVGMWAKAAAVGNAGRAAARCPRSQPVRRQAHRPYVHSLPGAKRPAPRRPRSFARCCFRLRPALQRTCADRPGPFP